MAQIFKALMWASFMLGAAWMMKEQGVAASASFAVIAGLTGAAVGSLGMDRKTSGCCA